MFKESTKMKFEIFIIFKESKQKKEREKHYQTSQNLPNHAGPCAKRQKKFEKE